MKMFLYRLLRFRGYVQRFYADYNLYLVMAAKTVTALAVLLGINAAFPYRPVLGRGLIVAAVSILCSILPWNYITIFGLLFLLGQLSALSIEAALFVLVLAVSLAVLSYVTLPGGSILWAVLPLLIAWKIPLAGVLLAGLFGGVTRFVSVGSGTVIYYVLKLIADHADLLSGAQTVAADGSEVGTLVQRLLLLVKGFLNNEEMIIVLIVFSLTTLLVHFLSRTEVDYARVIAILTGAFFCPVLMMAALHHAELDLSVGGMMLSTFLGLLISLLVYFFAEGLDYTKTEKVQFEDDEYYYYVKAVPKIRLPGNDMKADPGKVQQRLKTAAGEKEKGR